MPRRPQYQTPRLLPDLPLSAKDTDHFHFKDYAATLARLIADKTTRTPLVIGVHGSWGSGKTSLLQRVRQMLMPTVALADPTLPAVLGFLNEDENPNQKYRVCRTVWFNAWKYGGEEHLLVALLRAILREMYCDDFIIRSAAAILDPFKDRRELINSVLGLFSIPTPFGGLKLDLGAVRKTSLADKMSLLDQFDPAFDRLMAAWVHLKRGVEKIDPEKGVLVVFIDDLDRCLPDKTVQVLEAVKLFLDKEGCVFVLAADRDVVRQAVETHYQNSRVAGKNAADYLEKIIHVRFDLPIIESKTMGDYLKEQKVERSLQERWQMLVAAGEVNPRRVKAVINDLSLQWAMAYNSGQESGLNQDDFICWHALMHAAPPAFLQRLRDLDDHNDFPRNLDVRVKFVKDALAWAKGEADEASNRVFQEYAVHRSFRDVLREIGTFHFLSLKPPRDAIALDAIVHMTAAATAAETQAAEAAAAAPSVAEAAPETRAESPAAAGEAAPVEPIAVEAAVKPPVEKPVEVEARPVPENRLVIGGVEFVRVPAGKFLMGSREDNPRAYDDEKPQHTLELPEFWMARFPVTNEQYAQFAESRHRKHPVKNWAQRKKHPVVKVSWKDALDYCKWFEATYRSELKKRGLTLRLPTEAEWEKAARGEYGNEWPWGNEFDPQKANTSESGRGDTAPVDAHPQGASPYGAEDMAGNVWEWTHTLTKGYPYRADDGREEEKSNESRVLRGGSWYGDQNSARCACRHHNLPDQRLVNLGFRVAAVSRE
ncbi:MAG: SUMF1/EgtB/PvdO family nonheme iron enzyme [Anaerolineales bacterium]